jgi:hypothetical protein
MQMGDDNVTHVGVRKPKPPNLLSCRKFWIAGRLEQGQPPRAQTTPRHRDIDQPNTGVDENEPGLRFDEPTTARNALRGPPGTQPKPDGR